MKQEQINLKDTSSHAGTVGTPVYKRPDQNCFRLGRPLSATATLQVQSSRDGLQTNRHREERRLQASLSQGPGLTGSRYVRRVNSKQYLSSIDREGSGGGGEAQEVPKAGTSPASLLA